MVPWNGMKNPPRATDREEYFLLPPLFVDHNEHVSNLWCTVVVPRGSAHSHSRARAVIYAARKPASLEASGPWNGKIISRFHL